MDKVYAVWATFEGPDCMIGGSEPMLLGLFSSAEKAIRDIIGHLHVDKAICKNVKIPFPDDIQEGQRVLSYIASNDTRVHYVYHPMMVR